MDPNAPIIPDPNRPGQLPAQVAVVYLSWLPYGISYFRRFLQSYTAQEAEHPHDLVLLFNGVQSEEEMRPYLDHIQALNIPFQSIVLPGGQDIAAYHTAAEQLPHEYLLFFNTYTQILAPGWLRSYMAAIQQPGTGLVGASGSYQSHYTTVFINHPFRWEKEKSLYLHFRKYKLFVKAFLYWRLLFRPFPNPHIRTNGFIIRRTLFLSLSTPPPKDKFSAYQFESGRKGMTERVRKSGRAVLLMDKWGNTYPPEKWPQSNTYWAGEQENLLVSDNQTVLYTEADREGRKKMTFLAWGIKG